MNIEDLNEAALAAADDSVIFISKYFYAACCRELRQVGLCGVFDNCCGLPLYVVDDARFKGFKVCR